MTSPLVKVPAELTAKIEAATAEVETTGEIAQAIAEGELSGSTSKWISGALWTTLILFAAPNATRSNDSNQS